jgi:hypothetical protein
VNPDTHRTQDLNLDIASEIRQAIERSEDEIFRLEDPLNCEKRVLLKGSAYERIERLLAALINNGDDWQLAEAYAAAVRTADQLGPAA